MRLHGSVTLDHVIGLAWEFDTSLPRQFRNVGSSRPRIPHFERNTFHGGDRCWTMDWMWFAVRVDRWKQ